MRLKSTPAKEDEADWLYPHENDKDEWIENYGSAIALTDCADATIRRCRGRHGQNGILLVRTTATQIYDCDFSFLSGWGLALYRSSKNLVAKNLFDYCVRGYSHGVYWRGQDSAGILMFERCCDNVFARNSATHGGDGVFLFAGNDTVQGRAFEKGEKDAGGSDRNVWYENDFSFAVANSIEATFSRDNWALENDLSGSHQHGVWGGYSSRTVVHKNKIENTVGGAVSIEHGQECAIIANRILGNTTGVELWWDEDKELVRRAVRQAPRHRVARLLAHRERLRREREGRRLHENEARRPGEPLERRRRPRRRELPARPAHRRERDACLGTVQESDLEWLGRTCVATRSDAHELARRQLAVDSVALGESLPRAKELRLAAFEGLHEGGMTKTRRPPTRLLQRRDLSILYVVHGFPPDTWAGTEVYTLNLAKEMQRRGHRVTVATRAPPRDASDPDWTVEEGTFDGLRAPDSPPRRALPIAETYRPEEAVAAFFRGARPRAPDLVHFQHVLHLRSTLAGCADARDPRVVTLNDYWPLCSVQLVRPTACAANGTRRWAAFHVKDKDPRPCPSCAPWAAHPAGRGRARRRWAERRAASPGKGSWLDLADRNPYVLGNLAQRTSRRAGSSASGSSKPASSIRRSSSTPTTGRPRRRPGDPRAKSPRDRPLRLRRLARRAQGDRDARRVDGSPRPVALRARFGAFRRTDVPRAPRDARARRPVGFRGPFEHDRIADVHREIDVLAVPSTWFELAALDPRGLPPLDAGRHERHRGWRSSCATASTDSTRGWGRGHLASVLRRFLDDPSLAKRLAGNLPREDPRGGRRRRKRATASSRAAERSRSVLPQRPGATTRKPRPRSSAASAGDGARDPTRRRRRSLPRARALRRAGETVARPPRFCAE
jgi:hypothetical protein